MSLALNRNVYANHSPVVISSIRNGAAGDIQRTSRVSSIPNKYFFTSPRYTAALRGNAANREPPIAPTVFIEACIRSAFATEAIDSITILEQAAVDAGTHVAELAFAGPTRPVAHAPAAGVYFDRTAAGVTIGGNATARISAIALGAARAGATLGCEIAVGDLNPTETGAAFLNLVAPAAAADAAAYNALLRDATNGWEITTVSVMAAMTESERLAVAFPALTVAESELAYFCFRVGQVCPVRAGVMLIETGHHYLSSSESTRRHRAIESEALGEMSAEAKAMWSANVALIRGRMWHTSIHPISIGLMTNLATAAAVKDRMARIGLGSSIVGLPAMEPILKRASAYTALLAQVQAPIASAGHIMSMDKLRAAVTALSALPTAGALPAERPALPDLPAAPFPPTITTRVQALDFYLAPYIANAAPVAAWCFGFYKEVAEAADIRAGSASGSLLGSYALKTAARDNLAMAQDGAAAFRIASRLKVKEGEAGRVLPVKLEA